MPLHAHKLVAILTIASPFLMHTGVMAQGQTEDVVVYLRPKPLPTDVTPRLQLSSCGLWTGFYGPIDYRKASTATRVRVESYHWDEYFSKYRSWISSKPFDHYIAQNFGYTLRAFPNHPSALLLMEQISRRLKVEDIPGSYYPMECWYLRALQTVPDDPMVRAQYGIYLAFRGRTSEARHNLDLGDRGLCLSPTMQYQIGLANLHLGAHAKAQLNAMRATRRGFSLNELQQRLTQGGHWSADVTLPEGAAMDCEVDPGPGAAANAASAPAR